MIFNRKKASVAGIILILSCIGQVGVAPMAIAAGTQAATPDSASVAAPLYTVARDAEAKARAAGQTDKQIMAAVQAALAGEIRTLVASGVSAATIAAALAQLLAQSCSVTTKDTQSGNFCAALNAISSQLQGLVNSGPAATGGDGVTLPTAPDPTTPAGDFARDRNIPVAERLPQDYQPLRIGAFA
eukprot:gene28659-36969_t